VGHDQDGGSAFIYARDRPVERAEERRNHVLAPEHLSAAVIYICGFLGDVPAGVIWEADIEGSGATNALCFYLRSM